MENSLPEWNSLPVSYQACEDSNYNPYSNSILKLTNITISITEYWLSKAQHLLYDNESKKIIDNIL